MNCSGVKYAIYLSTIGATLFGSTAPIAIAAPVKIEAIVATKEQIRLDFADGSKHFVAMVKREGKASGQGPLAGTVVTEYGRHDIIPGVGGDPSGYLVFSTSEGDAAYVKWLVRAVFVPGADNKPVLLDNGVWEVIGASGKFKGLQGAGTLHIKSVSQLERNFVLEGDLVAGEETKK